MRNDNCFAPRNTAADREKAFTHVVLGVSMGLGFALILLAITSSPASAQGEKPLQPGVYPPPGNVPQDDFQCGEEEGCDALSTATGEVVHFRKGDIVSNERGFVVGGDNGWVPIDSTDTSDDPPEGEAGSESEAPPMTPSLVGLSASSLAAELSPSSVLFSIPGIYQT